MYKMLCVSTRRPLCVARTLTRPVFRHYASKGDQAHRPRNPDTASGSSVLIQDIYAQHIMRSLHFFKRVMKFSLVGVFAVGLTTWTAFEGAHMWVEKVELSPEEDKEIRRWGWDREADNWFGGETGGTDSALGFKGRHAVRSAWITQNWGTGHDSAVVSSGTPHSQGTSGINFVDTRLQYSRDFLNTAITIAEGKTSTGNLHPATLAQLLSRYANILERMGSRNALFESRSQYERAWSTLPGNSSDAARIALKLGDLNHRLGDDDEALMWWARAIHLTRDNEKNQPVGIPPAVPREAPSSSLSQRILTSTLVSLSAFYATSGQLRQAQAVQEASLDLLRSIRPPDTQIPTSPPQALHTLYLIHRSSLISIHLAEILFALHNPPEASIELLTIAARSSERVARALMHQEVDSKTRQLSSESALLPVYSKSRSMVKPAGSLLRDARRSAGESWNLLGILSEKVDDAKSEKVLECYKRALSWTSVENENERGDWQPGEGIPESEWQAIWANYVRARDAARDDGGKA
jgi:tetratricopeptide (TPR) repeat protein